MNQPKTMCTSTAPVRVRGYRCKSSFLQVLLDHVAQGAATDLLHAVGHEVARSAALLQHMHDRCF